jgi:hypothetical protein
MRYYIQRPGVIDQTSLRMNGTVVVDDMTNLYTKSICIYTTNFPFFSKAAKMGKGEGGGGGPPMVMSNTHNTEHFWSEKE